MGVPANFNRTGILGCSAEDRKWLLEAEILPQVKYQRRTQTHWVAEVLLGTDILRMWCLENLLDTV